MEHSTPTNGCGCACLSRRRFMTGSAAALTGLVACPWVSRAYAAGSDEEVDVATLRVRPAVTVVGAVLRFKPPVWLGWPGTSYDYEGHLREYSGKLETACKKLGVTLSLPAEPLETEAAVNALVARLQQEKPDGVVVILQHMGCWGWAERLAAAGVPTVIFSPVGTSFTGHVSGISRQPGVYVASSLDFGGVEYGLRMIRAKRRFEETRLLLIAGDRRDETVMERLGMKVRRIPRRTFNELYDRMPESKEVQRVAKDTARHAKDVVEPTAQDRLNGARVYTTAKRLLRDENANGLSMDCLGMVGERLVPTPPCMAWSILQDAGITCGCEADLFGAVSLLFTSHLFDQPGFMNDPVAETVHNLLIASHCTCGSRLNGFDAKPEPYILRSHSESDKGVSMQVLWKPGQPVTLVRFRDANSLILDTGVVVSNVDTPPAGGCRTSFEIRMDEVKDARDVQGFHQVVFYGNHRREVEAFCQMYGLEVTHSA